MDVESDPLARLIAQAGPRRQPSVEMETRVRAAAHRAWQSSLRRARYQQVGWLSAAAAVIIAVVIGSHARVSSNAVPAAAATLMRSTGSVQIASQLNGKHVNRSYATDAVIYTGDEIDTGNNGAVLIALGNKANLRLADHTHVHWVSRTELELTAGALYVDSGSHSVPLSIKTPYGTVSHLGTRYQVRSSNDALNVGVRDGIVEVKTATSSTRIGARQTFRLDAHGKVVRADAQAYGDEWAWVDELAPRFTIDNRNVAELLEWIATETGHTIRYRDAATRNAAVQTILHGASDSLSPAQALAAVMPTTDFSARYEQGQLVVQRRQ